MLTGLMPETIGFVLWLLYPYQPDRAYEANEKKKEGRHIDPLYVLMSRLKLKINFTPCACTREWYAMLKSVMFA